MSQNYYRHLQLQTTDTGSTGEFNGITLNMKYSYRLMVNRTHRKSSGILQQIHGEKYVRWDIGSILAVFSRNVTRYQLSKQSMTMYV